MTERMKNFKLFKKTLAAVLVVGSLVTAFVIYNSPHDYRKNKDKYNYTVELSYDKITQDRILTGEEVYLNEEEYKLYENTISLRLIKKINRLSYLDSGFKEATEFYEAKYSDKVALSNEDSKYKVAKTELINEYLTNNLSDKKYLTTSNVYLLSSKDDFDYIKEVVYFIDTTTFEIKSAIEIDSKYSHKKDVLEYADYTELSSKEVSTINEKLNESMTKYTDLNSLKDALKKEYNDGNISKVYIYDSNTLILYMDNNKTIKVNISKI